MDKIMKELDKDGSSVVEKQEMIDFISKVLKLGVEKTDIV